jgi:hypothetical protein
MFICQDSGDAKSSKPAGSGRPDRRASTSGGHKTEPCLATGRGKEQSPRSTPLSPILTPLCSSTPLLVKTLAMTRSAGARGRGDPRQCRCPAPRRRAVPRLLRLHRRRTPVARQVLPQRRERRQRGPRLRLPLSGRGGRHRGGDGAVRVDPPGGEPRRVLPQENQGGAVQAAAEVRLHRPAEELWGYPKFTKRDAMQKLDACKGDSFIIRCQLIVINSFRTEEKGAPKASPGPIQSPCHRRTCTSTSGTFLRPRRVLMWCSMSAARPSPRIGLCSPPGRRSSPQSSSAK